MSASTKNTIGNVLSAVGSIVGIATEWTGIGAVVGAALVAIGGALSYSGQRQLQKEAEARARQAGRKPSSIVSNVRGSYEHHNIVFGKRRIGGIIVSLGTQDGPDMPNQYLYLGIAHSIVHAGGCEGVTKLWVDDTAIPLTDITGDPNTTNGSVTNGVVNGLAVFRCYRGTDTQTADATLTGAGIDASTDYRRGIAWTMVRLKRGTDEEGFRAAFRYGIPVITAELKGWRCYDPRCDATNGGSDTPGGTLVGGQRLATPSTWAWSDNPIICAATYAITPKLSGGWGRATSGIDWPSVASAANVCDEIVTPNIGGARARYSCNGAFSTAEKREVNLQRILDSCDGKRITVGGKWKFYAGAYRTPTVAITEDHLAGAVQISSRSPVEGVYNAVRVNYDDASLDYKTVEAPNYTSSAYEAQDGGQQQFLDMTLPMVANNYSAQILAQIKHKRSRYQGMLTLSCNLSALDWEVWETATVTLPNAGDAIGAFVAARVWRIVGWQPTEQGIVVSLLEENSAIYTIDNLQTPNLGTTTTVGAERPPTITGLTAQPTADGNVLSWSWTGYADRIQIERAPETSPGSGTAGSYSIIGYVAGDVTAFIDRDTTGALFFYRVIARTFSGALSAAYSSVVTSTAKQAADQGAIQLLNGGFEGGDRDWTKGGNWTIQQGNARLGNWAAKLLSTGSSQTSTITNTKKIPCSPGDVIQAYGYFKTVGGTANGNALLQIEWLDSSGSSLSFTSGNALGSVGSYAQSRVVGTAPASAASARVVGKVQSFTGTAGTDAWFADDFTAALTPKEAYNLTVVGSGQRLGDQRNEPAITGLNRQPSLPQSSPLTIDNSGGPSPAAGTLTITIASFTQQVGSNTISYNSGSKTSNDATYSVGSTIYVYADDPTYAGGAVTYNITNVGYTLTANDGRFYVGSVVVPARGASGSEPPCVAVGCFLHEGLVIEDARQGDAIRCLDDAGGFFEGQVTSTEEPVIAACYEIELVGGARVACSESTPLTLRDGRRILMPALREGDELAGRYDGVDRWEPVTIIRSLGRQPVVRLHCGGHSYAAGYEPHALIYTHNPQKP